MHFPVRPHISDAVLNSHFKLSVFAVDEGYILLTLITIAVPTTRDDNCICQQVSTQVTFQLQWNLWLLWL